MAYQLTTDADFVVRHRDNELVSTQDATYLAWRARGNFPEPPIGYVEPTPALPERLARLGLTPADLVTVLESEADIKVADLKRAIQAVGPAQP